MRHVAVTFAVVASALLAGCDMRPEHAEWRSQCIRSHEELMPMPTMVADGRGGSTTTITMMTETVCDETAPICVAGKDGSTTCPNLPETTR
ncbi:hypothetical protein LK533_06050 [Sphingomonas sp. PL-96]|uniref:hypothetical protein n=1 Tax=Sphingomonas sp. PL-96 TaxID=2887201 RepID=UPI001E54F791|nr:hypothetical protein [Sphingomonas sp. PL-96]MCC2976235.1 hypothetical protein [Sphingomonas sp. PL-96]